MKNVEQAATIQTVTLDQILHGLAAKLASQNGMDPNSYRRFCVDQQLETLRTVVEDFGVVLVERLADLQIMKEADLDMVCNLCDILDREVTKVAVSIASDVRA